MKTIKHLFTTLLLLCTTVASAHDFEVYGIYYNILSEEDKTVEVTYKGISYDQYIAEYGGNVVIPEYVTTSKCVYKSWTSTNKSNSTTSETSYTLNVEAGDILTFDWSVSSEEGYDYLIITLDGSQIVKKSGETSGNYKKTFDSTGTHTLVVKYTKDSNRSDYSDEGKIYNIVLDKADTVANEKIYTVISIGERSFYACSGLASIEIPNNIKSIRDDAFYNCTGLTAVYISNLALWCNIDFAGYFSNPLCYAHKLYLNDELLTELVIPDGVTEIKNRSFEGCTSLTSIEIHNGVTSVGNNAFEDCTSLKSIVIGRSMTSIGDAAFSDCTGLKTIINFSDLTFSKGEGVSYYADKVINVNQCVQIGDFLFKDNALVHYMGEETELSLPIDYNGGNYEIGSAAFYEFSGLTNIVIPNSVTGIGDYAFTNCTGLGSFEIPNSITSIGNYVFNGCTSLKDLRIEDAEEVLSMGYHTYGTSNNGKSLFYDCPLETLYIGRNLSYNTSGYNGYSPFSFNSTLTSVIFGGCVTSIGNKAFRNCSGLTSVEIGNSVTSIGEDAFWYCSGLTSIEIPNSVTSIGDAAFSNCTGLKTIINFSDLTFSKGASSHGSISYYADKLININQCERIGDFLFKGNALVHYLGEDTELTLPVDYNGDVYEIGATAFYGSKSLTSIYISNKVTGIGKKAFYGCTNLCSVKIPDSVVSIGVEAFKDCASLLSVDMPNGITSIGSSVFSGCSGLTSINIPNTVTSIANNAFESCSSLVKVKLNSNTIKDWFRGNTVIEEVIFGDSVIKIGESAFNGCSGLKNLTIGKNIVSIGNFAFNGCISLKDLVIEDGDSILSLGYNYTYTWGLGKGLFYDCPLESLYLGRDISYTANENNGYSPFYNKSSMTSLTIGKNVTNIGYYGFKNCTGLNAVHINDISSWCNMNFKTSESNPLCYAKHLYLNGKLVTDLVIPEDVVEIKEYAFQNCSSLTSITLPKSISTLGVYAFYGCDNLLEVNNLSQKAVTANDNVFSNDTYNNACLYVPVGRKFAYEKTIPWNNFYVVEKDFVYSVTYIVDGEVYQTVPVNYGEAITLPGEPTKEGHTFSGWSEIPETMPAEDITVTGSFSVNSYDVTFVVDGEVYKTVPVNYGEAITLPEEPSKEGHTFCGWSEIPETMPAQDVVIEGSFVVNSYNLIYIVDGEEYKRESVAYGTAITLHGEPTKEGYTFSGWSEVPATMPAEDITVTGSFSVNSYDVTFIVDEEVYKTVSVNYGETIPMPEEPVKDGCTFSGWSEIPATMPAEDITITGSFYANYYTLTYMVDGEVYATVTVRYNAVIPEMEEPTKEGHTFSGWENIPETMPAQDITIIGSFTVNSYNAIFLVDNALYAMLSVNYGEAIELPEPPSKEGFVFDGWEGLPMTMPAKDIVLIAIFTDVTGVDDVKSEIGKVKAIYDLNGRVVENPTNGIYIINGKKVLIK